MSLIDPVTVEQEFGIRPSGPIQVPNTTQPNLDGETNEQKMSALLENVENIKYISEPTDGMCKYVIRRDPTLFKFIKNPKSNIVTQAVKADPNNIQYAPRVGYEITLEVLRHDGMLLKYVRHQGRYVVVKTAVRQNGMALQYVEHTNKSHKVCVAACLQNELAVQFVPQAVFDTRRFKLAMLEKYLHYWTQLPQTTQCKLEAVKINPAAVLMFGTLVSI